MSAHVPSKFHFDLLVRRAIELATPGHRFSWYWPHGMEDDGRRSPWKELHEPGIVGARSFMDRREVIDPSQFGQLLVSEAVMSVHARYPDTDPDVGDLPGPNDAFYMGPYIYANPGYTLSPGETFAAIDYLDYQSCEHDGWPTSEAHTILDMMRRLAGKITDGYGQAPWGYDGPDDLGGKHLEFSQKLIG